MIGKRTAVGEHGLCGAYMLANEQTVVLFLKPVLLSAFFTELWFVVLCLPFTVVEP